MIRVNIKYTPYIFIFFILIFCPSTFAENFSSKYKKVLETKQYSNLIKETSAYIRAFSHLDTTEAQFFLGRALFETQQIDEALQQFKDIYINYPTNQFTSGAIFYLGECHRKKGNDLKAREYYEEIKKNYTDSDYFYPALYSLSLSYKATNQINSAIPLLTKIITDLPSEKLSAEATIELAKIYIFQDDLSKAKKLLIKKLSQLSSGGYIEIFFLLGEINLKNKNYIKANAYYTKSLSPGKPFLNQEDALFGKAFSLFCLEQYDQSIETFTTLNHLYFNGKYTHDIYLLLSEAYFHREKFKKSLKLLLKYKKTIQKSPHLDQVLYFIAENQVALKKYPEAIASYHDLIDTYPNSYFYPYALYGLGWANYLSSNFLEGIEFLKEASDLFKDPDEKIKAIRLSAESLLKKNNYQEAANIYVELIKDFPSYDNKSTLIYRLGFIYYQGHQYQNAITTWKELTKQIHNESTLYLKIMYQIGWAYLKQHNYQKAISHFEAILPSVIDNQFKARILLAIANTHSLNNSYASAITTYNQVIKNCPATPIAHLAAYQIGWAYLNLKNITYAQKYFEKYLLHNPDSPYKRNILFWIGEVNYNLKKYDVAETAYKKICTEPKQDLLSQQSMFWWGESLLKQKKFKESIELFTKFIETYLQSDLKLDVTFSLGNAFFALKKYKEAKTYYEVITKDYPDSYIASAAHLKIASCLNYLTGKKASLNYYITLSKMPNIDQKTKIYAIYQIALFYIKQRDPGSAISHLENLVYNHNIYLKFCAKAAIKLGDISIETNDLSHALKAYSRINRLDTPEGYLSRVKIKNIEKKYF